MNLKQMQSPNRRWPKQYESWAQRTGAVQFIELRSSTEYPLTHYPYNVWASYTACGAEHKYSSYPADLTTYVR